MGDIDLRVRRNARRLSRPYISHGSTEPGTTGWRSLNAGVLAATVDTSLAGFLQEPFYFATIQGDFNKLQVPAINGEVQPWLDGNAVSSSGPTVFVTDSKPESFVVQFVPWLSKPDGGQLTPIDLERRGWVVTWFGFELMAGCHPLLVSPYFFWLSGHLASLLTPANP